MKGIMLPTVVKVCMVMYFGTYLVSGEVSNATSVKTATTPKPTDLVGAETGHYENTAQLLRPGESLSRSKSLSYSKSNPEDFEYRNPDFEKERYEERASEYQKDSQQREEYHNGNEGGNNYNHQGQQEQLHQQPEEYRQSYGGSYEQQNHGNEGRNYDESPEQRNAYPVHSDHGVKAQAPYSPQDYNKEESYEPAKENSYDGGRPQYLRYAYEVSNNQQQQAGYEHLEVPNNNGKSGYGSVEAKAYPQEEHQQQDYYPVPNPTRYVPQDNYKGEEYGTNQQKGGDYFNAVPKEAGYAPNGQKEPEYLQSPPNEPSYSKQAGYSSGSPEPAAYLPNLPKEKPAGTIDDGKVAVFIKHLGHKNPASNQYVNKERRGYLLLPVVNEKMAQKLKEMNGQYGGGEYKQAYTSNKEPVSYHTKELNGQYGGGEYKQAYTSNKGPVLYHTKELNGQYGGGEYKQAYTSNKEPVSYHTKELNGQYGGGEYKQAYTSNKEPISYHTKSPVVEKEIYVQPKVVDYPVKSKATSVHYGSSYGQDISSYNPPIVPHIEGYVKPQAKSVVSHGSYGSFKPIIKHTTYVEPHYESPKVHAYATKGTSDEAAIPYITKTVSHYEEEPESKSYSAGSLGYAGAHPVIPSYIGAAKYGSSSVYAKPQSYVSSYDVTSAHKAVPVKVTGIHPSPYASLPHEVHYAGVSGLSSLTKKDNEKVPVTSHLYSPQYKTIGARYATVYESPKLEISHKSEKPGALILPQSKEPEPVAFHPSAYSSKGRISAKSLVEDFGLHNYESLLTKPKHGSGVGGLYYDLHSFPAHHTYSQFGLRKSGLKYYS